MSKNDNSNKSGKSGGKDQGQVKKDFNRDSGSKPTSISNTAPPPRRPPPKK